MQLAQGTQKAEAFGSSFFLENRKSDNKLCSLTQGTVYGDAAVVGFYQLPGDGQSHSTTGSVLGIGLSSAIEASKDVGQFLFWNSRAGIGDNDLRPLSLAL